MYFIFPINESRQAVGIVQVQEKLLQVHTPDIVVRVVSARTAPHFRPHAVAHPRQVVAAVGLHGSIKKKQGTKKERKE